MQPREKPFYVKLTFSTTKETKNETKPVDNSESKSNIKVRSRWTVFPILLMSAVTCVEKVVHGNETVQYLQNKKCHEVNKDHSRRLF